jgi:hypothetical protein
MRLLRLLAPAAFLLIAGCHSAYIDATLSNRTDKTISLVELDYPSASFGTQSLAPGQDFHYRFKILGAGKMKLVYTDTTNLEHTVPGPQLGEGDEGSVTVTVQPSGVQWGAQLKGHKKDEFPIAPN